MICWMMIAEMKWTLLTVVSLETTRQSGVKVKISAHIQHRWQNILTKLSGVTGPARNTTMSYKAWNSITTDKILANIVQHTNQYILISEPKFSSERDAKLTDKIKIKAFIHLLCLAGVLRSNNQKLDELWGTDFDGIQKFCLVINHRCFKFLIICILELTRFVSVIFFTFFFSRNL